MKIKFTFFALLLLMVGAAAPHASALTVSETSLLLPPPSGEAYEVNQGEDGYIYLSDSGAKQVWRINPANGAATVYQLPHSVQDARPGGTNRIWWTDGSDIFGRINLSNDPLNITYWTMPMGTNLWGTAIDSEGQLWMTEWMNNTASEIFRFDPTSNTYCEYKLYKNDSELGGAQSYHILYDQGFLWIANWDLNRIIRLDPGSEETTWWQITGTTVTPIGLALDEERHLWWADEGLGALNKLDPDTKQAWSYPLIYGTRPKMVLVDANSVWYTEYDDNPGSPAGTFGVLHPQSASVTPTDLTWGTASVDVSCNHELGDGITVSISSSSPTLSWDSLNLDPEFENPIWSSYQLPTTDGKPARPYGISAGGDYIWMSDHGRQKILRFEKTPNNESKIYLPIITK